MVTDESGWSWLIPLHNGTVSIDIVMNKDRFTAGKKANPEQSLEQYYLELTKLSPSTLKILGEGSLNNKVQQASDYSYQSSTYAGPYFRIVGDAGAFIDPFFSSGVHLAFATGLSAATTIASSMHGEDEGTADGYTRFLFAKLSAYKQMQN